MGLATLLKTDLNSLAVRLATVDSDDFPGIRTIGEPDQVSLPNGGSEGLLSIIGKAIVKATGWLFDIGNKFGIGGICIFLAGLGVSAINYVMNFNWNATDAELDAQLGQFGSLVGGQLGGAIGNALGWITCGVLPGLAIYKFNALLGVKVLMDVGEEGLEELAANVKLFAQTLAKATGAWLMIQSFKGWRRMAKVLAKTDHPLVKAMFTKYFGTGAVAKIKKWGEKGSKPWTFAKARDEFVESLPDGFVENFAEELLEEWWDGCVEAVYVVASDTDQWMLEQELRKKTEFGTEEVIEIAPNRDYPDEKIVLAGPQELIKPVIVQTMAQHQLLDNRDVGMWVGEPVRENVRTRPMSIQLRIILSSDPNVVMGKKRVQITIPDVNRSKIDWSDIKSRVGGANGYMWGPFRGKAKLDGGNEICLYASTAEEAVDRLTALAYFSNQEILGISVLEEKREGKRKTIDALFKRPTRIYPYAMTIINQQKVLNEESGTAQLTGVYKAKRASLIPLHTDNRPDDFSEIIAELFRTPGPG